MTAAQRIVDWLRSEGAAEFGHAGSRRLLDHLVETAAVLRRWGAAEWLQHAALIHSVYGTEAYEPQLVAAKRRADVAAVAGARAERLAHLFTVTPRKLLFAGTHTWARVLPSSDASRDELDCLVLLHMANLAEQAQARDGGPARWLARVRDLAELLIGSEAVELPLFIAGLAGFSAADEGVLVRAYRDGGADAQARSDRLALAAAVCPVVAEPCVWLAYLARGRGDAEAARRWAQTGARRLLDLGTAWDKRLSFEEWREVCEALGGDRDGDPSVTPGGDRDGDPSAATVADPRALLEAVRHRGSDRRPRAAAPETTARFERYVRGLAGAGDLAAGRVYPGLEGRAWHDPSGFPVAGYLESHYAAIRDEILALGPARFHRESERIGRAGDWDVAFLYERGRRHDDICAACPVTARGVEAYPAMRTAAGLIYVSRMRGGTHIAAHRGPTNLRVRCHLGIVVPDGDCAIRVGEEIRRWQEGTCLVFDDFLEHEAWNHTTDDRIVLIVDLWHPGLSAPEIALLEGLHTYIRAYARGLSRYWATNSRAAGASRTPLRDS